MLRCNKWHVIGITEQVKQLQFLFIAVKFHGFFFAIIIFANIGYGQTKRGTHFPTVDFSFLPLAKKTFVRSFFFSSSSFRTMFTSYIGTHSFHRSMLNRVTNRHTKRLRSKTHLKCAGKHMIGALEVDISPKILVSNVWSLGLWGSFRSYLLLFLKFFQRSRESLFIFLHFGAILSRSFIIFRLHTMSCWL